MPTTDNEFFSRFAAYDNKTGILDERRTATNFIAAAKEWDQISQSMKPVILAELGEYHRLGQTTLVPFVCHRLRLPVTSENVERVEAAIKALEDSGKIVRNVNKNGGLRGRDAGFTLANEPGAGVQGAGARASS